jgi:hypothetical protein
MLEAMVRSPDFPTLRKERVYLELKKALLTPAPWLFLETLASMGGLELVYAHADTRLCRKHLSQLLAHSEEHRFIGLIFEQSPEALQALSLLPLSRIEKYFIEKIPYFSISSYFSCDNGWLDLFDKTDALRRRSAFMTLMASYDAIHHTHHIPRVEHIWTRMDQTVFPEDLRDAPHTAIKAYYKDKLIDAIHESGLSAR